MQSKKKLKRANFICCGLIYCHMKNSVNPFPEVRYQIEGWKQYAVAEIVETPDIVQHSMCIQETGLKPKDALHIACAIH